MSSSGRSQQDLMITQLVQQNKELIDANKRQYIEIQAQSATLEEQRIHINVLDSALKRLEEEIRQKQLYQKQLQSLLGANERRDKMRLQLEDEMSKDKNRSASNQGNAKWEKEMGMDADSMNLAAKMNQQQMPPQDIEKSNSEAQLAQNKVNEMQLLRQRLKLLETRLAEKEKDDLIRQLHEQKRELDAGIIFEKILKKLFNSFFRSSWQPVRSSRQQRLQHAVFILRLLDPDDSPYLQSHKLR